MELSVHGRTIRKIFLLTDKLHYKDGLNEAKEDQGTPQATDLDVSLVTGWSEKSFSYDVRKSVETRQVGDFVVQLNPARARTRRPPDAMDNVRAPFDPHRFNFTKVDFDKEALFEFRTDKEAESDFVIVNVSPLEFGHSLLVPKLWDRLPQMVTERSILVAAKAVMASGLTNFKAAFDSLCGHASVNHLHWHLYYLREPYRLPVETVQGNHLGYGCYSLDYTAAGFGFQITNADSMIDIAGRVQAVAKVLCDLNVAHNIFITKGTPFTPLASNRNRVLKVLIWPRKNVSGAKNLLELGWAVAVCELAGHVLVYDEDKYKNITEDEIIEAHRENCQETFEAVKFKVISSLETFGQVAEDTVTEEVNLASSDGETGSQYGTAATTGDDDTNDEGSADDVDGTVSGEKSGSTLLNMLRANRAQLLNDFTGDRAASTTEDDEDVKPYVRVKAEVKNGQSEVKPTTSNHSGQNNGDEDDDCVVLSD